MRVSTCFFFFSVVYFSRGTLPTTKGVRKGTTWGPRKGGLWLNEPKVPFKRWLRVIPRHSLHLPHRAQERDRARTAQAMNQSYGSSHHLPQGALLPGEITCQFLETNENKTRTTGAEDPTARQKRGRMFWAPSVHLASEAFQNLMAKPGQPPPLHTPRLAGECLGALIPKSRGGLGFVNYGH